MDDFVCIMVANQKTQARRDFWADFRRKIGALAVAGLVVLTTLMNPVNTEKAPSGV
ncbi:MAG: hypothetical protein ACK4FZ_01450 [Vogesella sp.]|uniref:hypothetical protein n=1 Tax=Vogesella sp. TaxID=1904252 RepID=UPI00391BE7CB